MSKKNKPLPQPSSTPFTRKKGQEGDNSMMADKMAAAMAQGNLDEFVDKEYGGNEHVKQMANLMMGMTGMGAMAGMGAMPGATEMSAKVGKSDQGAPSGMAAMAAMMDMGGKARAEESSKEQEGKSDSDSATEAEVPEDIMNAIQSGDVEGLKTLLREEHARRSGKSVDDTKEETTKAEASAVPPAKDNALGVEAPTAGEGAMEKEVLDSALEISRANNVSMDWIMSRALSLYVRDYKLTGRM